MGRGAFALQLWCNSDRVLMSLILLEQSLKVRGASQGNFSFLVWLSASGPQHSYELLHHVWQHPKSCM